MTTTIRLWLSFLMVMMGVAELPALAHAARGDSRCSTTICGANSPEIGDELHLWGQRNQSGVRIVSVHLRREGESIPLWLWMGDHELMAIRRDNSQVLRGQALVGLEIKLSQLEKNGPDRSRSIRLAKVGSIPFWYPEIEMPSGKFVDVPPAPLYQWVYLKKNGDTEGYLCPRPSEDVYAGLPLDRGISSPRSLPVLGPKERQEQDFSAVMFTGDRYDAERREVRDAGQAETKGWVNLACHGNTAFKMHLSGHSEAAAMHYGRVIRKDVRSADREEKQAFLNALTGIYFGPGTPTFTQPGQALLLETNFRLRLAALPPPRRTGRVVQVRPAFRDRGRFEAVWDHKGIRCIGTLRRSDAEPEVQDRFRSEERKRGLSIRLCTDQDYHVDAPGTVVTFVPGSCRDVIQGRLTCGRSDDRIGCQCASQHGWAPTCFDFDYQYQCVDPNRIFDRR